MIQQAKCWLNELNTKQAEEQKVHRANKQPKLKPKLEEWGNQLIKKLKIKRAKKCENDFLTKKLNKKRMSWKTTQSEKLVGGNWWNPRGFFDWEVANMIKNE